MSKFTCLLFVAALIACNAERQPQSLSASNLTSTYVSIEKGKDTSITTAKGAIITIQAGTFDSDVELEIKEAYSMAHMLLAGLVTESNGELLQSDGMIYINTKDGEEVDLKKPIAVSIPAGSTENMQLYKGEEGPAGSVNWINPVTLNKVLDTPKPGKPQSNADGIVADSLPQGSDTSDYYAWQITEGDTTGQSWVDTAIYGDSISVEDYEAALRGGFIDQRWSDNNYLFEINTLGWYNIDAGMRGLAGTTLCDVKALVQNVPNGIELSKLTLYLFIPSRKNLSVGVQHADSRFYFEKWEGKIPLYTGDKAFLLAFGNKGDTFFYGITGFTVATAQEITINLNRTTRDHFLKQVKELKFEGITFAVEKQ